MNKKRQINSFIHTFSYLPPLIFLFLAFIMQLFDFFLHFLFISFAHHVPLGDRKVSESKRVRIESVRHYPTSRFTILGLTNPSHNVPERKKIYRFKDFEALKLGKGSSGTGLERKWQSWKLSELENVKIGKCQNWKVSEMEGVRIEKCQNQKASGLESVRNCLDWRVSNLGGGRNC